MPGRNRPLWIWTVVPGLLVQLGCASTTAPDGWLPDAGDAGRDAYGAWVTVERADGEPVEGELITVGAASVTVLQEDGALRTVFRDEIVKAKLTTYHSRHGLLALWTALGALSTLSHGIVLVISAPFWILAGGLVTVTASHQAGENPSWTGWNELRKFARYPQGMPEDASPTPRPLSRP